MSSSEDEEMDCDTQLDAFSKTLPPGTRSKYHQTYLQFQKWKASNGYIGQISEDMLKKYFEEISETSKPSTLFAKYSMLKDGFRTNDGIDISKYTELLHYLKEKNNGYKPPKSRTFTDEEIDKFINEAPDEKWLDVKVVCILAASGANSSMKLLNVMVEHVKRYDDLMLVTMPKTDTTPQRTFTITGKFFSTVQKYADLRPENVPSNRFLLNYFNGRCTAQQLGKGKIATLAKKMATYLKLPDTERYSVISFRRNAPTLYVNPNAWNPTIDDAVDNTEGVQLDYETGLLRMSQPTVPTIAFPSITTTNGNKTDTGTEHVCTLSCANVKCASEENEKSALHAFTAMKPSEYVITDITPTIYPSSEPACRWLVAYTHKREAVSALNAYDAFEEITRSIPNNVRINQKYIRGDSSQSTAAYVVAYGVNCKCHKETTDIFTLPVNEI